MALLAKVYFGDEIRMFELNDRTVEEVSLKIHECFGMTREDVDMFFVNEGRPFAIKQTEDLILGLRLVDDDGPVHITVVVKGEYRTMKGEKSVALDCKKRGSQLHNAAEAKQNRLLEEQAMELERQEREQEEEERQRQRQETERRRLLEGQARELERQEREQEEEGQRQEAERRRLEELARELERQGREQEEERQCQDELENQEEVGNGTLALRERYGWLFVLALVIAVALAVIYGPSSVDQARNHDGVQTSNEDDQEVQIFRTAFGSCTAYDQRPQPIWEESIVPSSPDAWIWLGDLAYLDEHGINCGVEPSKSASPYCNCTLNELQTQQMGCKKVDGDVDHAVAQYEKQLSHPHYQAFVNFMCQTYEEKGEPPIGENCERPILGTWDDHDFGINDGNRLLRNKRAFKELFLDAVLVGRGHPRRRRAGGGIHWRHTLAGGLVEVFLLDERYNRDPLPCYIARDWCIEEVLVEAGHRKTQWCKDFLHGGDYGEGTCCRKDEEIFYGWCQNSSNHANELWPLACDPAHDEYGMKSLVLKNGTTLGPPDGTEPRDEFQSAPLCEVLGRDQRRWLRRALRESAAPVKLIASGSVVLAHGRHTPEQRFPRCAGDDWDCYGPAQRALLAELARAPGCAIILTGDYHYSDIKVMRPGPSLYSSAYQSESFPYHLYQVMASGMTRSTAQNYSCSHPFRVDDTGLREPSSCSFVNDPAFGVVDIEFSAGDGTGLERIQSISLQIIDESGKARITSQVEIGACNPMPSTGLRKEEEL